MKIRARQYLLLALCLLFAVAATFAMGALLLHDDNEFVPQVLAWVVSMLTGLGIFWIGLIVTVFPSSD